MKFIPIKEKDLINVSYTTGKLRKNYAEKKPNSWVKGSKQYERLVRRLKREHK